MPWEGDESTKPVYVVQNLSYESTSLTVKYESWMSMNGGNNPMKPKELQGQNKKEEFPEPARQEKPSLKAFFAWMMEDLVGESVAWVMEKRILRPAAYLLINDIR